MEVICEEELWAGFLPEQKVDGHWGWELVVNAVWACGCGAGTWGHWHSGLAISFGKEMPAKHSVTSEHPLLIALESPDE